MWRYGLIVFAGYVAFLAATVPAHLVVSQVALPPSVALTDVRGTIWSGRAVLMATAQQGAPLLSRVRFHVWPGALLHGRWGYVLTGQGPLAGHVAVAVTSHRVELADMALTVSAKAAAAVFPALRDEGAGGAFAVRDQDWVMGSHPHGGGALVWRDARLASAPVDPLGSYRLVFSVTPAGVLYTIHTLSGKLVITGHGHYGRASRMVSFRGLVTGHGLRLQGFLSGIGFSAAHGARRIRLRLPLSAL